MITAFSSGLSSLVKLVACRSFSQNVVGSILGLVNFSSATEAIGRQIIGPAPGTAAVMVTGKLLVKL